MKILITTPLYPPDIAPAAQYIKELATRLKDTHDITILAYSYIPEEISGVHIIPVSKRQMLPVRLFHFTQVLIQEAHRADVVYAENGSSVELPLLLLSWCTKKPIILHIGDKAAHAYTQKTFLRKLIHKAAAKGARHTLTTTPLEKPEIIPFKPYPEREFENYESSWHTHLDELSHIFQHATT